MYPSSWLNSGVHIQGSILKMDARYSSNMSVFANKTAWCNNPDSHNLSSLSHHVSIPYSMGWRDHGQARAFHDGDPGDFLRVEASS
jgi:hypothetical protein